MSVRWGRILLVAGLMVVVSLAGWLLPFTSPHAVVQDKPTLDLAVARVTAESQSVQLGELKQRFDRGTQAQRLQVAIEAIDRGLVCPGCSIANVDAIFSTHFANLDDYNLGHDDLHRGAVMLDPAFEDFNRFDPSGPALEDVAEAAALCGWYLSVRYTRSGRISGYELSNIHKDAFTC